MAKVMSFLNLKIYIYVSIIICAFFACFSSVKYYMGNVYFLDWKKSGKTEDAEFYLEKAIYTVPSRAEYFYEMGRVYHSRVFDKHTPGEQIDLLYLAQKYIEKALTLQPGNSRYMAEMAWIKGNLGDMAGAVSCFEKAIAYAPTRAFIHMMYASWALTCAQKVINTHDINFLVRLSDSPSDVLSLYERRFVGGFSIMTFLKIAERELDKALELGIHKDRKVYENLGNLFLMMGKIDRAIDNYRRAGDDIRLAQCYFINRDFKSFFSKAKLVIERKEDIPWAEWTKIKVILEKIVLQDDGNYEAYYWLGRGYYRLDMFEESIEHFKKGIQLNPDHIESRLFLAKSYEAVKKTDMAIQEYITILKTEPGHREANMLLAKALKSKF